MSNTILWLRTGNVTNPLMTNEIVRYLQTRQIIKNENHESKYINYHSSAFYEYDRFYSD